MYYKLALNNVKKSIKDFTIYFLTLTFGVCLFYIFNSIESQQTMMELSEMQAQIITTLSSVMNGVSAFVAVILGFLIIYASNFLIKRRKKELGIYMTLGMRKGRVSRILICETFIISIFSLGAGLVVGVFLSQGLSVVTAKIFEVDLTNFHFVLSTSAIIKTIIYFGIIFVVVMLFNVFTVSKYKLITLLNADKRNEKLKLKKLWLSVVLFIISIGCLVFAYRCIIHNGFYGIDLEFKCAIIFGIIGTLLFFMSLSGFLLKVIQGNKKFYFRGLNMFVLRQINSKINTTYVSMSLICIMLLITIGTLSCGLGVANALNKNIEETTPFDASFYYYEYNNIEEEDIPNVNIAETMGNNLNEIAKEYVEVCIYKLPLKNKNIATNSSAVKSNYIQNILNQKAQAIKLSDYNKILKMQGKNPITLTDSEYAINCNNTTYQKYYNLSDVQTLDIDGKTYSLYNNKLQQIQLMTSDVYGSIATLILPDNAMKNYKLKGKFININYKQSNDTYENKFVNSIYNCTDEIGMHTDCYGLCFEYTTKINAYESTTGMKVLISYLAIYIGFVFLITCVAVLALQQLSESSDNIARYNLLREIGTEEKMINKALFWQVFIYFMIPLVLAIIHSVVGIYVVNNYIKQTANMNILSNIIFTAILFLIIYWGYFIVTYFSCKNMIREKR